MNEIYIARCGFGRCVNRCIYSEINKTEFNEYDLNASRKIGKELCEEHLWVILHGDSVKNIDFAAHLAYEDYGHLPIISNPILCEVDSYLDKLRADLRNDCKMAEENEVLEFMMNKAKALIADINAHYQDKKILIVSNGLFCRCLESVITARPLSAIVWMEGMEHRCFTQS